MTDSLDMSIVRVLMRRSTILRKTGCSKAKSQQSEGTHFDWLIFVGVTKGCVRFSQKVVP